MKKRSKLTALATLGVHMGLLLCSYNGNGRVEDLTPEMRMFYDMLDPQAQQQFLELDKEHRQAAMSVMNQYCKAANECKGIREKAVEEQYQNQIQS